MADTFLTFLRYRSKELLVFQETPSKCKLPTPTPSIPKSSPSLPAWSSRRRKVTWPKKARQPHAFDVFLTLKKIKDSFQVENMTTGFPTSQAIFRAYACNFRFLGFFLKRKCQKSNYKNSWLFGKARSSSEQPVLFPLQNDRFLQISVQQRRPIQRSFAGRIQSQRQRLRIQKHRWTELSWLFRPYFEPKNFPRS